MTILPCSIPRRLLFLAGICSLFFAVAPRCLASAEDKIDDALALSKAWIAQIDAGQYEESYDFGCGAMHDKVTEDKWLVVLKTLRASWGSVVSRKQISHIYKPDGFEGLQGECLVITYDTSFQKLDPAKEVVVLKWEDGKWRGAGYNVGPKPLPPEDQPPQQDAPQTETTTTTTKTPPQSQ